MHSRQRTIIDSFRAALAGFAHALRNERNVRIHCAAAVVVLAMALFFRIDVLRLVLLFGAIGAVLGAELFNTAIEVVVDLQTREYHPLAKVAKDVAAAAVFVHAVVAVAVGYAVFIQYMPGAVAVLPFGLWSLATLARPRRDKEVARDDK